MHISILLLSTSIRARSIHTYIICIQAIKYIIYARTTRSIIYLVIAILATLVELI